VGHEQTRAANGPGPVRARHGCRAAHRPGALSFVRKQRHQAAVAQVVADRDVQHAQATYGHTPVHNVHVLESEGKQLVLLGDLIHVASVQLESPEVTIGFDSNETHARSARASVFKALAKDGSLVAVAHFPFPGVGRLRAAGKGFVWEPLNYSSQVK